jgi:hypothetical protein
MAMRACSGALGLAVLGSLAASHSAHAGGEPLAALTDGFRLAFVLGALLCLAGALVAAALLRPGPELAVVEAHEEPEASAA